MEHTKEPWASDENEHEEPYQNIRIKAGRFRTICTVGIDDAPVADFNSEQRLNARRIVDCVNDLAGIENPAAYVAAMGALAAATQHLTGLIYDAPLVAGVSGETAIEIDEAMEAVIAALQAARATMGERDV